MHLTNFAINKDSEEFIKSNEEDPDIGTKRSYRDVLDLLENMYGEKRVRGLEAEINDIVIKSLCLAEPHITHLLRAAQPEQIENNMCFHILGFDIMLDEKMNPLLLEINEMPSFAT